MTTSLLTFKKKIDIDLSDVAAFAADDFPPPGALFLRAFDYQDAQGLCALNRRNKDTPFFGVTSVFKGNDEKEAEEMAAKYIAYYKGAFEDGRAFNFGLFEQTDSGENLIGRLGVCPKCKMQRFKTPNGDTQVKEAKVCDLMVYIDQAAGVSYGTKGYTKAAVRAVMREALENGALTMEAVIDKKNLKSIHFFKKLGFVFQSHLTSVIDVTRRGWYYDTNLENFHVATADTAGILKNFDLMKSRRLVTRAQTALTPARGQRVKERDQ